MRGTYAYEPIMPPKLPQEDCSATDTARLVGDSEILLAFHVILRATAGKVPMAAKNVPAYRAPGVFVLINTTKPTMPTPKTAALILKLIAFGRSVQSALFNPVGKPRNSDGENACTNVRRNCHQLGPAVSAGKQSQLRCG